MYSLKLIESLQEFNDHKDDWIDLESRCKDVTPFNRFVWYRNWYNSFGQGKTIKVICIYMTSALQRKLAAVMPLLVDEANGCYTYNIWANTHSFRTGLLCDDDHHSALNEILEYINRDSLWKYIYIPYISLDSKVNIKFHDLLDALGMNYIESKGMLSPKLEISGSWDKAFSQLSKKTRETLRRKAKKIEKQKASKIIVTKGASDELDELLNDCWLVSARTWKHKAGSSIASDQNRIDFYNNIAHADDGWIVLGLIYIDERPVAFEYNILYKNTLYNLKLGYDEKYSTLSPGIVLRLKILEWAYSNNVGIYDYMGNAADYKLLFSTDTVNHVNIKLYSKKMTSRMNYFLQRIYRSKSLQPFRKIYVWIRRGIYGTRG